MNEEKLQRVLSELLSQDEGFGDLTGPLTPKKDVDAEVIAKQDGVASGIKEGSLLFEINGVSAKPTVTEGQDISDRDCLLELSGCSTDILLVERTALNLISFMSGIASRTREYVELAGDVSVAATRKTHPFFTYFAKKAVSAGGGLTHRYRLDDLFIFKDNHLSLFEDIKQPVIEAKKTIYHKVEVEVTTKEDAFKAVDAGADIIMLDNMSAEEVGVVVEALTAEGLREKAVLEASGGITLENLKEYCKTKVDVVSTSALTQAPGLDVALSFK